MQLSNYILAMVNLFFRSHFNCVFGIKSNFCVIGHNNLVCMQLREFFGEKLKAYIFSKVSLISLFLGLVFLSGAGEVWGQIAQRGTATTATSGNNTLTIARPSGLQVGDLMISTIHQTDNDDETLNQATPPAGWTFAVNG